MVNESGMYHFVASLSNGKHIENVDYNELEAIIRDHLPYDCRHLWPMWGEEK